MRWIVALVGAAVLVAGSGLTLRLIRRPELRVALNLRPGDPDDAALAAGVDLALEERDGQAGRFRVKTAHQVFQGPRPSPCAHTMLPWFGTLDVRRPAGEAIQGFTLDARREAEALLAWARQHKLRMIAVPSVRAPDTSLRPNPYGGPATLELLAHARKAGVFAAPFPPVQGREALVRSILATSPELVFLDSPRWTLFGDLVMELRKSGFEGPVFIASRHASLRMEGARILLASLPTVPPEVLPRHPSPLGYATYRGTLRYLDALDAAPGLAPEALARELDQEPIPAELLGPPAVFVIRNGRLSPE